MRRRSFVRAGGAALVAFSTGPRVARAAIGYAPLTEWALSPGFVASLPELLETAGVPGVSVALAAAAGPADTVVAGRRAAGRDEAVTPGTVFAAGSLSKPVLATVALALGDAGVFDLDRPVADYLESDLPSGPGAERITSRHALRHTTGLMNWRFTLETALATARAPGEAWGYSGEGIILVQRAIEAATGRGLEALAREHLFEPLGMASTTFIWRRGHAEGAALSHVPATDRFADYAELFRWKERALVEWAQSRGSDPDDLTLDDARRADTEVSALAAELAGRSFPSTDPLPNFLTPNAAGSLKTTAFDYTLFLGRWLADEGLRRAALGDPVPHPGGLRWGLGWGMEPSGPAFWHWGEGLGFRALAYADPGAGDRGEALVALTNGNGGMDVIEATFVEATGARSPLFDVI